MKRTITSTTTETQGFVSMSSDNVMEGVPSGLATVKAATSIDTRPHILTRRSARWARRANH